MSGRFVITPESLARNAQHRYHSAARRFYAARGPQPVAARGLLEALEAEHDRLSSAEFICRFCREGDPAIEAES